MIKEMTVTFTGDVQGVGFRAECCEIAHKYMVDGWVRNTLDGAVELKAQGEEAELQSFLHGIENSRLGAMIEKQQKTLGNIGRPLKGFNIRS